MEFDIGIGGLYHADTYLFRAMDIKYVKLSFEDIEAWTMQYKLGMPAQSYSQPSSYAAFNYEYHEMPKLETHGYRSLMYRSNFYSRLDRLKHLASLRQIVPPGLWKEVIDNFDQEHTMILSIGVSYGLFDSNMTKPDNIDSVFPLR